MKKILKITLALMLIIGFTGTSFADPNDLYLRFGKKNDNSVVSMAQKGINGKITFTSAPNSTDMIAHIPVVAFNHKKFIFSGTGWITKINFHGIDSDTLNVSDYDSNGNGKVDAGETAVLKIRLTASQYNTLINAPTQSQNLLDSNAKVYGGIRFWGVSYPMPNDIQLSITKGYREFYQE